MFTKTDSGGTDNVWFYDMQADGYSLDDKRNPLVVDKHDSNNLPDILTRWNKRKAEAKRERTEQSFLVPKAEIVGNDYDLSINRYKQVIHEAVEHQPPQKIVAELKSLESEISNGVRELEEMLA